jgi:hypothetical protein
MWLYVRLQQRQEIFQHHIAFVRKGKFETVPFSGQISLKGKSCLC